MSSVSFLSLFEFIFHVSPRHKSTDASHVTWDYEFTKWILILEETVCTGRMEERRWNTLTRASS